MIINRAPEYNENEGLKMKAVLYKELLLIKFIINKGTHWVFEPKRKTSSSHLEEENDCRKEPQKLQKEGPEEEGVSCPFLRIPAFALGMVSP